jgi:hypothetical protein
MTPVLNKIKALSKTSQAALRIAAFVKSQGDKGATCDEVEAALDLTHQSASARFNELKACGVLVSAHRARKTRSGGSAEVHKVHKDATFTDYISGGAVIRSKKVKGLSETDQAILGVGRAFVTKWSSASPTTRKRLITDVVVNLGKIAER